MFHFVSVYLISLKIFFYFFDCIRSWLQHAGSFIVTRGLQSAQLSSCCTRVYLPQSMWDLSSPTRDQTCIPCIGRQRLNHWTARKVPSYFS